MTREDLRRERNLFFFCSLGVAVAAIAVSLTLASMAVAYSWVASSAVHAAVVAVEWAMRFIFLYLTFRFSRFLRQPWWATAIYCVLAPLGLFFAIPFMGLLVGTWRANRSLKVALPAQLRDPRPQRELGNDLASPDSSMHKTAADAEQLWAAFRQHFSEALADMERLGNMRAPDPFERDADAIMGEQTTLARFYKARALEHLADAKTSLMGLSVCWPTNLKGVNGLMACMTEYEQGIEAMGTLIEMTSPECPPADLREGQQLIQRFKRHLSKGDNLLNDGLTRLGRSLAACRRERGLRQV